MISDEERQQDHLALAHEYIRQLQQERHDLARIIAQCFADCYASSYLRGDEVAKIVIQRFGEMK